MKFTKGNLVAQSKNLSTDEMLRLIANLKATVKWKSRAIQTEYGVRLFYHPRLVDFRYVDLDAVGPYGDQRPEGFCAGALGYAPNELGLERWLDFVGNSGLKMASFTISPLNLFQRKAKEFPTKGISLHIYDTGMATVSCWGLINEKMDDDDNLRLFQRLLDAAGYADKLRADRILVDAKFPSARVFALEVLDRDVRALFREDDDRSFETNPGPYLDTGRFSSGNLQAYPGFQTGEVLANEIRVGNYPIDRAIELHKAWLEIFLANASPVLSNMCFFSQSLANWPMARKWLTERLPNPWVMGFLCHTRGREKDVEKLVAAGVPEDCLIPLGYWNASVGPRLLLDAVANTDGSWELWVHGSRNATHKTAVTIREEIAAISRIPDLFSISQVFPWGGWCEFVMTG